MRWDDDGFTILELSATMLMAAIIGAVMLAWLGTVAGNDVFQQEAQEALEEMTGAKGRIVKELRFAGSIDLGTSTPHSVDFWVDLNGDGISQAWVGEQVSWTIKADGTLVRTDDSSPAEVVQARTLVYDAAAGADSSHFTYDTAGTSVTVQLVADVDSSDGPLAKRIRTEVHLRGS